MIDTKTLSAENSEVVSYFGIPVPRKITAELSPQNNHFTDVKFKRFSLGPIGFDAPDSFRGALDITYLDDEVRLTRGDKGKYLCADSNGLVILVKGMAVGRTGCVHVVLLWTKEIKIGMDQSVIQHRVHGNGVEY